VGLQRIGGDHHPGQVEWGQQRGEGEHLLGRAADLLLGQHRASGVVHAGQQVHRAAVTAWGASAAQVLPSTATARRRPRGGLRRSRSGCRSASHAPMVLARTSASRRESVRRTVASAGTAKWPGASGRAPSAARTGWGASAAHSAIAAIDRAPARTAAAARPRMATMGGGGHGQLVGRGQWQAGKQVWTVGILEGLGVGELGQGGWDRG
jgi:hypothetical protein